MQLTVTNDAGDQVMTARVDSHGDLDIQGKIMDEQWFNTHRSELSQAMTLTARTSDLIENLISCPCRGCAAKRADDWADWSAGVKI